jgi:hypothetical protein
MADPIPRSPRRTRAPARRLSIALRSIQFISDHALLKGCKGESGWRNEGARCTEPEWTPSSAEPLSITMGRDLIIRLEIEVDGGPREAAEAELRGVGPSGIAFVRRGLARGPSTARIELASEAKIERKVQKLPLTLTWTADAGARVSPGTTSNVVYVTMGRPQTDRQGVWAEDGVTLKRMDRAVSWVEPLGTLDPHEIVTGLLAKFPFYTLLPSPKVPRQYRHPTYFNGEGGAWAMSDFVEESGECQAIVRLIRGMLRQLGAPGQARVIAVWGDPNVGGGREALSADLEEQPSAGLDAMRRVGGRVWRAALIDAPVEEGKTYPASHTRMPDGSVSPGLNRYEACLEFTHGGVTRYYAGGAGVIEERRRVLEVFWGLIWFSPAPNDGFRVEKIVARYGLPGGEA